MDVKKHITALGFIPKNGTSGIYHKIYSDHNNYVISIDFDKEAEFNLQMQQNSD